MNDKPRIQLHAIKKDAPWAPVLRDGTVSSAAMMMLSFGRILVASNQKEGDEPAIQEAAGASFNGMLAAMLRVSICSAQILDSIIDWDAEVLPWSVFEYDYLDMEAPNSLPQWLMDRINDEDWLEMAENCRNPMMDKVPFQMLEDFVVAWAKTRELPLCGLDTPTAFILRTAKNIGVTVEVRKHYIGQFATVYVSAPAGLGQAAQHELLRDFKGMMNDCPGLAGGWRMVMTRFDNPPRFNRYTGKMDPGHPRHGDPLLEIDSFIWEGE